MTANERGRPVTGDVFGKLRVLRTIGRGERVLVFCQCQKSFAVAVGALLTGTAECPRCAPDPPEQREALREQERQRRRERGSP
jgi:hypothetical protein